MKPLSRPQLPRLRPLPLQHAAVVGGGQVEHRALARQAVAGEFLGEQPDGRAGPLPAIDAVDPGPAGFTGSCVIAVFASLEDAESWAAVDPYIEAGVYAKVTVKPFKKVLP